MGKKLYTRQSETGLPMPKKSGVYNLGEYCNHYCHNVFFNLLVPLHQEICDWDHNSLWNSSRLVGTWIQIFSSSVFSVIVSIWSGRTGHTCRIPIVAWFRMAKCRMHSPCRVGGCRMHSGCKLGEFCMHSGFWVFQDSKWENVACVQNL